MVSRFRPISGVRSPHQVSGTLREFSEPLDFFPSAAETTMAWVTMLSWDESMRMILVDLLTEGLEPEGFDPADILDELFGDPGADTAAFTPADFVEQLARGLQDALHDAAAEGAREGLRQVGRTYAEQGKLPVDIQLLSPEARLKAEEERQAQEELRQREINRLRHGQVTAIPGRPAGFGRPPGSPPPPTPARGVPRFPNRISLEGAFDLVNPQTLDYARTRAGTLIRNMGDDMRPLLRSRLVDVLQNPANSDVVGVHRMANLIERDVLPGVKLDDPRRARLAKFTKLQQDNITAQLAGLTGPERARVATRLQAEADRRVAMYSQQLTRERAQVIARTEIQFAQNHGKLAAFRSAADDLGLYDKETAGKRWLTGPERSLKGRHVCPVCVAMSNKLVGLDSAFPTANGPLDAPPAHPSCRCTFVLVPDAFPEGEPDPDSPPVTTADALPS